MKFLIAPNFLTSNFKTSHSVNSKQMFAVSEPPEAPEKPQIDDITAHSMLVTWNEPNDNGSPILGYWVERREINSSRWTRVNR